MKSKDLQTRIDKYTKEAQDMVVTHRRVTTTKQKERGVILAESGIQPKLDRIDAEIEESRILTQAKVDKLTGRIQELQELLQIVTQEELNKKKKRIRKSTIDQTDMSKPKED